MPSPAPLHQSFYTRDTLTVARDLLGRVLVRVFRGKRLAGRIVETEAYIGENDSACHASRGLTQRTRTMYGPPGIAYIYLVYGMHSMLNFVTEPSGKPCAVLIRALEPLEGLETMKQLRQTNASNLTRGPGRLTLALNLSVRLNGWDVTRGKTFWVERGTQGDTEGILRSGPRIGIAYASRADQKKPWRFWLEG